MMMEVLVSHVLLSVVFGATGLSAGWWLHSRLPDKQSFVGANDDALIRELLSSLHGLSVRMTADVDEHNTEMGAVDRELKQAKGNAKGTSKVGELVDRLLSANQNVQTKLTETEGKLDELSHRMEFQASEARIDVLTGLANRRAFQEETRAGLSRFYEEDEPFALVMVDIDRFKQVNDIHGHPFGDEVLREVGEILLDQFRGCDLVSRYGGEEFAVMMPASRVDEARRVAENLRETIEKTRFMCSGNSLNLTISAGAAEILPNEELSDCISRVDQAMYAAKHAGRNRVYWHDGEKSRPFRGRPSGPCPEEPEVDSRDSLQTDSAPAATEAEEARAPIATDNAQRAGLEPTEADGEACSPLPAEELHVELLHNIGNKTMFCQDLRRRIAEFDRGGTRFSSILLRIDQGQSEGEPVLCDLPVWKVAMTLLAQIIQQGLREQDVVARYDDQTFGLVLPDASLRHAVRTAEKLRKAVQQAVVEMEGRPLRFTVSLGTAEVEDGDQMGTLIERVRQELEKAETSGGNRTGFSPHALVAS